VEKSNIEIGPRPIFETPDYRVDVVTIELKEIVHPSMAKKYAVTHKTHGVVAGLGEQLVGIIEVTRQLQDSLDEAVAGNRPGDRVPGSMPRPPRGGGGPGTPPQLN
jgi:hypothetical protein